MFHKKMKHNAVDCHVVWEGKMLILLSQTSLFYSKLTDLLTKPLEKSHI